MSNPPQDRHFIFYQMLLHTHTKLSHDAFTPSHTESWSEGKHIFIETKWWTLRKITQNLRYLPTAASFVDDLQSELLSRRPANRNKQKLVNTVRRTPVTTLLKWYFDAPHLSTHSLTTAKFPSPITLPTWYFSLMMEEETDRLPFTVRRQKTFT